MKPFENPLIQYGHMADSDTIRDVDGALADGQILVAAPDLTGTELPPADDMPLAM